MELREGFIKNDIGIIPIDWEIRKIGSVCEIYGRIGFRGYTTRDIMPQGEGAITISPSNIQEGKMDFSKCTYISWYKYEESPEIKIFSGDILLVKTGSTFGKTALVKDLFEKATINPQLVVLKKIKVDNVFLSYMMAYKIVQNQIKSTIVGGAIPTLSQQLVANYKIPLPPAKSEQTAIATALSDMDALITSLEKLIEKKKHIKQGVMQELLRPKEGWVEMSILELADDKKELFDDGDWIESEHIITEGIRLIQTGNIGIGNYIEKENKKYINEESFKSIGCKELIIGDILICRLAEPAGRACILPDIGEYKVVTSVDVTIFRPRAEIVNRTFLINVFSTKEWLIKISDMSGGTTHKRISRGALGRLKIKIPSIEEQNRIANILDDLEIEIQNLEEKLKKNRMLKQGMMQELLTGKIRLF